MLRQVATAAPITPQAGSPGEALPGIAVVLSSSAIRVPSVRNGHQNYLQPQRMWRSAAGDRRGDYTAPRARR